MKFVVITKPTKQTSRNILLVTIVGVFMLFQPIAYGLTFDPSNIISNSEFFNGSALALKDIQYFLKQRGGYLATYSVSVNGTNKSAAKIIYDAQKEYNVSSKAILATLQKEMSLVTSKTPTQRALDYAMGYGCPDSGGCKTTTAGFFKQIDFATWQFRQYANKPNSYTYKVGGTYTLSGEKVTIKNQATAGLYNYTPHIYNGNYNFWKLYNSWFSILYPDGTLLRPEGEPGIWLIKDGKKWPFHSSYAFHSQYDIRKVIEVPASILSAYPLGTPIKYPSLTLLQAPTGGIYMLLDDTDGTQKKYAITSRDIFNQLGLNPEEVLKVGWSELNNYPNGSKIKDVTKAPSGRLVQSTATGAIYYVVENSNGTVERRSIHSQEILRSAFPNTHWVPINQATLDSYKKGKDVRFRDGELIASPNSNGVYFISNGKRRPIPSQEVLNGLGFRWDNIVWTTDRALKVHPVGERLSLVSNE